MIVKGCNDLLTLYEMAESSTKNDNSMTANASKPIKEQLATGAVSVAFRGSDVAVPPACLGVLLSRSLECRRDPLIPVQCMY